MLSVLSRALARHLVATTVVALLIVPGTAARAADLTVSAAASLTNAFRALAPDFEAQNPGTTLQFNFAASDLLLAQIAKGAPVDVFASADQETMDRAEAQKLMLASSRGNFASNALVLITPSDSVLGLATLSDLRKPTVKRVALGKPEGVPAGRYAKSALEAAGIWGAIADKAVYAQNVRQALDYVARGEVDAGFVYETDALVQKDKVRIAAHVDAGAPIRYPVAVVAASVNPGASLKFIHYLASPSAQAVLARYGFRQP